jgi:hypothetical protein
VLCAAAFSVTLALASCSAIGGAVDGANLSTDGFGLGSQAITPTSTPTPSSGWISSTACPQAIVDGEQSSVPAGASLTPLDPTTIKGVPADPTLLVGYVGSCAFKLEESGRVAHEILFVGMPSADADAITAKLEADGFTGAAETRVIDGSQQQFTKGTGRVVVQLLNASGVSVVSVIGNG